MDVEVALTYYRDGTVEAITRTGRDAVKGRGTYEFLGARTIGQTLIFEGDTKRIVKEQLEISFDETGMLQTDERGDAVKYTKTGDVDTNGSARQGFEDGRKGDMSFVIILLHNLNDFVLRWLGIVVCVVVLILLLGLFKTRVVAQLCRSRTHPLIGFSVMPLGRS
jgi:hypothetical protein